MQDVSLLCHHCLHRMDGEYSPVNSPYHPCASKLCKPRGFVPLLGSKKARWLHFLFLCGVCRSFVLTDTLVSSTIKNLYTLAEALVQSWSWYQGAFTMLYWIWLKILLLQMKSAWGQRGYGTTSKLPFPSLQEKKSCGTLWIRSNCWIIVKNNCCLESESFFQECLLSYSPVTAIWENS